jgi:hypothetical protein
LDTHNRLRIATRIHFALMRHVGVDVVDVGRMLRSEREAQEVLWVCDASGDPELIALAARFRDAAAAEAAQAQPQPATGQAPARSGHGLHDIAWAADTQGSALRARV